MQSLPRGPKYPHQTETVIVDGHNRNLLRVGGIEEAANARLIATGPELLAALRGALPTISVGHPDGVRAYNAARAAIAKAPDAG